MAMNKEAQELMDEYVRWFDTRRFFAPPDTKNPLVQFMPSKTGKEPNGPMSLKMHEFNKALAGTPYFRRVSFLVVYSRESPFPVKWVASEMNVSRGTIYRVADKTASELVTRTKIYVALNETK